MNRKFLVMVATVCGLVAIVALLLLSYQSHPSMNREGKEISVGINAINTGSGVFCLLFASIAAGFSALVFLGKTDVMGLSPERHLSISFLGWKLLVLYCLAQLIAGGGLAVGFWLTFIAGLVGTFAVFLTFNQALAQKIADKAKEISKEDKSGDKPDESSSES